MASEDLLQILESAPQKVFDVVREEDSNTVSTYFCTLVKQLLDPVSKDFSVLDEIYTDGLDAQQVFGQSKLVLEGVSSKLLFDRIPELKEKAGDSEDEDENDEQDAAEESDISGDEEDFASIQRDDSSEGGDDLQSDDDDVEEGVDDYNDSDTLHENVLEDEEEQDEGGDIGSDTETVVSAPKKDAFGLNDEFFDIDEFNKQILALEDTTQNKIQHDDDADEEEIDYFEDLSESDEEEDMPYFDDFYQKPGQTKAFKKTLNDGEDEEEEDEEEEDEEDEQDFAFDDDEYDRAVGGAMKDLFDEEDEQPVQSKSLDNLSRFEKEQKNLRAEIEQLEAELVAEKKWTMKGEVNSGQRPQDSLLDDPETAELGFDRVAKPVPIITDEVTETIESLIKRRIREEDFNDLPKRFITDVSSFHNKQKYELSEEKSKKSLAEIYEDQYANVDPNQEINEELKKRHDEISQLYAKVSHKLDSLCSAHYVPAPHQFKTIDIKVTDNDAAAISMEDAQPIHVASEATLAPQEIYKIGDEKIPSAGVKGRSEVQLKSGLSYSKDELSKEDKQRLRRANKRKRAKEYEKRQDHSAQVAQADKEKGSTVAANKNPNKKAKVSEVMDTLSKAKNVTVIGKKGELRDVKGNIKKNKGPQTSNSFML
ncbi:U3 snoRNP protein [Scheffersomyces spartinae]|uniref:U3 small nucleolar ribonucleoprotein protein MPP10 n=1 Tax=Scheffersomyces spartinae TaxID=45513 RepID=A0A9P7VAW0_9ASCO|nr:U3 snoRNP protein [Scheffersomyces spartinae]KAG7194584.1 U3 snoRNP protein [Scheffersomyces spartinae]